MTCRCDILIFGAGIAGLWLANTLKRAGYSVLVIEKDKIGAGQTMAAQGMIHGGQRYTLEGRATDHAASIAAMPERWEACLGGWGEIDLTAVKRLSEAQVMWPAGSVLADVAVFGAAKLVNAKTEKLARDDFPQPLKDKKKFKGPVYGLPEKVLGMRSLMLALVQGLKDRVLKGEVTEILPDGHAAVSGEVIQAQLVIFTAGTGNEEALKMLKVKETHTQRRPLRQIMVRRMESEIFGHGITGSPRPRVTITSHPAEGGGYIWYLGGALAAEASNMDESAAILWAQKEMGEIFPEIDWQEKEWATWYGDRAEPLEPENGYLPQGPFLHQRGRILLAWPTKLTFAPALSDRVFDWLKENDIMPAGREKLPVSFPAADIGSYPWETATWKKA